MATNRWGNCCSNKLCSMLSAILSTISFINGMWCHGSDYTPVTSDSHMCLYVRRENKSTSFKHATYWAWGNKQSALFIPYNKHYDCECMGGGQCTKTQCSLLSVEAIISAPYFKYCKDESHTAAWTPVNLNYKNFITFISASGLAIGQSSVTHVFHHLLAKTIHTGREGDCLEG